MIRAVGAAWNHYWCTLMKSHLFEVQALCLSSCARVSASACVWVCAWVSLHASVRPCVCVCVWNLPSPFLSPSAKPTPLKTHCREELEINLWGNPIPLKCQPRSSNHLWSSNMCHQAPYLRIKRFLWQWDMFRHCCVAPVLWQDNTTAFSCPSCPVSSGERAQN